MQHISLGIFTLSIFGLGKFLRAWSNFHGQLRIIRESQERVENPPAKPTQTRNGFQFSGKGRP